MAEILWRFNLAFESNDGVVIHDGDQAMGVNLYDHPEGFACVRWDANSGKSVKEHVGALHRFYLDLSHGAFHMRDDVEVGIETSERFGAMHYGLWEFESIAQNPHEFKYLRVCTPYASFALETSKRIWTPQDGRVGVISGQALGAPLADLYDATARIPMPRGELEDVLGQIFRFS